MAWLTLRRPRQYADMLREYRVLIDAQDYVTIRRGQTIIVELPQGSHQLIAKIDWCSSQLLKIHLESEGTTSLEVGSNIAGWRLFLALFYVTVLPDQYLYLTESSPLQNEGIR
jgi:hypothetical protein